MQEAVIMKQDKKQRPPFTKDKNLQSKTLKIRFRKAETCGRKEQKSLDTESVESLADIYAFCQAIFTIFMGYFWGIDFIIILYYRAVACFGNYARSLQK